MSSDIAFKFNNLSIHYRYFGFERSFYVDEKIIEIMLFRTAFIPTHLEKEARDNFWTIGKDKKEIDGEDYTHVQEEIEIKAIDKASFSIYEKESVSLIGETGSGKSSILLAPFNFPKEHIVHKSGEILYFDKDLQQHVNLLSLSQNEINKYRGLHFGLIPQLPREALNPWLHIGLQTGEILKERLSWEEQRIRERVLEYLGKVAIPDPKTNFKKFVNQLSTGEAQKVCISLSLMGYPKILFGDEIFSSLDAISQSQIIHLLTTLKKEIEFNFVLATHNIGAAGQLSDRIGVVYGGECVEMRKKEAFFREPLHPYSKLLLESTPWYALRNEIELAEIPGELPKATSWPQGCKFHPRCPKAMDICKTNKPPRIEDESGFVECFLFE